MWELGPGEFTPSKAIRVANLDSFRFVKVQGKIVKETINKLLVVGASALVVTTKTPIIENIHGDPLVIASAGVEFTQASE